jgi:dienelactone hydrolase
MRPILAIILVLLLAAGVQAKVVTQKVEYKQGDTVLEGYLAYDDAIQGKRPGVLVVHEWWGLDDFVKKRAEALAALGYVAFAPDMYGKGVVTKDPQQAAKLSGQFKDKPLLRERAQAGLKVLTNNPQVDAKRLAAIGFCFGGTTALELAYSGADLAGVVSFHGHLTTPKAEDKKRVKAAFLILHGGDDPLVTQKDVRALEQALRSLGADWTLIVYGGAMHSFMNPEADEAKIKGVSYDAKAAARAWKHMQVFLDELFSGAGGSKGKGK